MTYRRLEEPLEGLKENDVLIVAKDRGSAEVDRV